MSFMFAQNKLKEISIAYYMPLRVGKVSASCSRPSVQHFVAGEKVMSTRMALT